jgi:hypothetical protein
VMPYAENLPGDIKLWLMTADKDTGALESDVPLPVSHDALKRKLVSYDARVWVLTVDGHAVLDALLDD